MCYPVWALRVTAVCRRLCRVSRTCAEYRGIEQLVARRAHNPEVGGSSPSPATISSGCNGFQLHPLLYYRVRSRFTPTPFLLPQKNHHPRCIPPRTALSDCRRLAGNILNGDALTDVGSVVRTALRGINVQIPDELVRICVRTNNYSRFLVCPKRKSKL